MEHRENWCSDTSGRGSLKAAGILLWKSFEHLSLKQDRNQKQRLMRLAHHSVPHPKLSQTIITHNKSLRGKMRVWLGNMASLLGVCWLLQTCHDTTTVLPICMDLAVKLNIAGKPECVAVVLPPASVLFDPLATPRRAEMLLFLSDAHSS